MCLSAFLQILSASNVDFKWAPLSSKLQTNLVESFGEIDQKCSILSKEFKTGTTNTSAFIVSYLLSWMSDVAPKIKF